jgi:hypothetical protein
VVPASFVWTAAAGTGQWSNARNWKNRVSRCNGVPGWAAYALVGTDNGG